ncbi:hypothetical protein SRABI83_02943 [Arthrobacter sp. Bi83]|nr:hypothetical protein SRABI83_02943 [Arthrobacter sp. Bi83]
MVSPSACQEESETKPSPKMESFSQELDSLATFLHRSKELYGRRLGYHIYRTES